MATTFPDLDVLSLAVVGGLVPATEPVSGRTGPGGVTVEWAPPPAAAATLRAIGALTDGEGVAGATRFDHWLQLIPARRDALAPAFGPQSVVLFELPVASLDGFLGELLRLGHDRWEVMTVGGQAYVRAVGPPYYTLLAAVDRLLGNDPRAYRESAPGVWVEWGYAHPLADRVEPRSGRSALVRGDGVWADIPAGPFHAVGAVVSVSPAEPVAVEAADGPPFAVPLTLAAAGDGLPPSLWVAEPAEWPRIDEFVSGLEPTDRDRFAVAIATSPAGPMAVIRRRPGPAPAGRAEPPGRPFRNYLKLPHLYLSPGRRLNPPLIRESVRKLVAADPGHVNCLDETGTTAVAEAAFHPLGAWIDRVIERDRDVIEAWVRSAEFDFADAAIEEVTAGPAPAPAARKPKAARPETPTKPTPALTRRERPMRRPEPIREQQPGMPRPAEAARQALIEAEAEFLAVDGPLDHPARQGLWPRIARLNAELGHPAEAALAWAHAVWESARPADEQLWGWASAEKALPAAELTAGDLDRLLAPSPPSVADARAFAAAVTWAGWQRPVPPALRARLGQVQQYLQAHERMIPVRLMWLAWSACAHAAGGDSLALARARDRLLARLYEAGLSPEADLPGFLRFAGRDDVDQLRDVRGWLEEMRGKVQSWYVEQTKADPAADPTTAYIDLLFAFGFARLGEAARARDLMRTSTAVLDDTAADTRDAHLVLLQGYTWRIEQALQGLPHAGPLPRELLEYLAQMHAEAERLPRSNEYNKRRTGPYAVERLREQSRVLEPLEKFDPYRHTRREGHEIVRQAARLPDEADAGRLVGRINELLRPTEGVPEMRVRVLAECVPLLGRLGADFAGQLLDRVPPALAAAPASNDVITLETRIRLIERSLFFAAHFDRAELVPTLIERLAQVVEADAATSALDATGQAIGQTLRGLRRLGLRDDAVRLLERLETTLLRGETVQRLIERPPRNWPAVVQTLLPLAAGWLFFERPERATPTLDAARRALARSDRPVAERAPAPQYAQILVGWILATGHLPPAEARQRIGELFAPGRLERLPNTFTSAPFYSRFHIVVAEAVVTTLSGDEFSLGPSARRWLDEDEYLIRRRVHRDVRAEPERG